MEGLGLMGASLRRHAGFDDRLDISMGVELEKETLGCFKDDFAILDHRIAQSLHSITT